MNQPLALALPLKATNGSFWLVVVCAVLLTALADILFFGRHNTGVNFTVFILILGSIAMLLNRTRATPRSLIIATGTLCITVPPSIEAHNTLSVIIALSGLVACILILRIPANKLAFAWYRQAAHFIFIAPFRSLIDSMAVARVHAWNRKRKKQALFLIVWILPLACTFVFIFLFAMANPLIDKWLTALIFLDPVAEPDWARVTFWLFIIIAIWPFVRPRLLKARSTTPVGELYGPFRPTTGSQVFGPQAITRSLILFNVLFALQSCLDVSYLWAGAELPDGMTYARYAHRGAYPLMVTALLAAAFVLAAMRRGSESSKSSLVRQLVYFWTAQNILLVISSIKRLSLYVEFYSLTYWRVAAFIWMFLVIAGLVLIFARIRFDRSNLWLVNANALVLAVPLFATSLTNVPSFIASYNVAHSREAGANAVNLDIGYLYRLGPQAIPAIDAALTDHATHMKEAKRKRLRKTRVALAHRHEWLSQGWRAWTFRSHRLTAYLDSHATPAIPVVPAGSAP